MVHQLWCSRNFKQFDIFLSQMGLIIIFFLKKQFGRATSYAQRKLQTSVSSHYNLKKVNTRCSTIEIQKWVKILLNRQYNSHIVMYRISQMSRFALALYLLEDINIDNNEHSPYLILNTVKAAGTVGKRTCPIRNGYDCDISTYIDRCLSNYNNVYK